MIELTVEMLKKKIAAHGEKVKAAKRVIYDRESDVQVWLMEIESFKAAIEILERDPG